MRSEPYSRSSSDTGGSRLLVAQLVPPAPSLLVKIDLNVLFTLQPQDVRNPPFGDRHLETPCRFQLNGEGGN